MFQHPDVLSLQGAGPRQLCLAGHQLYPRSRTPSTKGFFHPTSLRDEMTSELKSSSPPP